MYGTLIKKSVVEEVLPQEPRRKGDLRRNLLGDNYRQTISFISIQILA